MTRPSQPHAREDRRPGVGFTLVELIAVLVIVAILAGVAVPNMGSLASSRRAAAARQLLRDLTFARQRAIATGTTSWVVFNVNAETWSILAENPQNPGRAGATIISDPVTGLPFTQTLGTGDLLNSQLVSAGFNSQPEIGFDWLGAPLNSTGAALTADGSVVLSGGFTVTVEAGTGYATLTAP